MTARASLGTGLVSMAIVTVGAGVLWMTSQLPTAAAYSKIGPKAFPYAIGTMLLGLGLLLARDAWKDRWPCEANDPDEPPSDLAPLVWVGAGLIANLLLIKTVGFILSSTVMYVFVAHGFGARRIWVAALVGFALAMVAYFGFAELLGLRMGDGLIEDLF